MGIVAAGLCVLLMFGALAVDMSTLYVENTRLQTALDAGVLAGASMLPDTDAAITEARSYILANGFSADNITFSFENDNMTITAQGTETVDAGFSSVMGYAEHDVAAAASAEKYTTSASGPFAYLLFSGDPNHTLNLGGRFDIAGSVHSNGSFYASPSYGVIQGAAEACKTVYCNEWTMTVGTEAPGSDFIDMPDFTSVVAGALPSSYDTVLTPAEVAAPWWKQTFNGNTYVSGNCKISNQCIVNGVLYVDGDLTIDGGSPVCELNGTIFATGKITFNNTFVGTGNVFARNITYKAAACNCKQPIQSAPTRQREHYMGNQQHDGDRLFYAPKAVLLSKATAQRILEVYSNLSSASRPTRYGAPDEPFLRGRRRGSLRLSDK
jgi:cytoskeletal protein CcmA (bactofilin family)